jgi:hypothetical protein
MNRQAGIPIRALIFGLVTWLPDRYLLIVADGSNIPRAPFFVESVCVYARSA